MNNFDSSKLRGLPFMKELKNGLGALSPTTINIIIATIVSIFTITIVSTAFFIITSSIGINIYNSCDSFGPSDENRARVKPLQVFFILMLVLSLLVFVAAVVGLVLYFIYIHPNFMAVRGNAMSFREETKRRKKDSKNKETSRRLRGLLDEEKEKA